MLAFQKSVFTSRVQPIGPIGLTYVSMSVYLVQTWLMCLCLMNIPTQNQLNITLIKNSYLCSIVETYIHHNASLI